MKVMQGEPFTGIGVCEGFYCLGQYKYTHHLKRGQQRLRYGVEIMDNAMQTKIHQIIADTLAELGIPVVNFSIANTTILIRDGYYVGHSMLCGHVRIVLLSGGERLEFYDQNGNLLKVIGVSQPVAGLSEAA
jgi:hypothetical protein